MGVWSRSRNTCRQIFADVQAREGYLGQGDLEKQIDMGVGWGWGSNTVIGGKERGKGDLRTSRWLAGGLGEMGEGPTLETVRTGGCP